MNVSLRRTTLRATMATALSVLFIGSAALTAAVVAAPPAGSTTIHPFGGGTPPWEPDPNSVGGLTFYNSSGDVITGGSINDSPIAAYVQGGAVVNPLDTRATLYGYLPVNGQSPGQFSGEALGASTLYPNSSAPAPLNTSTLPLETGASGDETIAELMSDFPNLDTSNDGYANMYVLRLKTTRPGSNNTTYDSADIMISGSTWSIVYGAVTPTTTTLTASPPSPQPSGTSVTLTATVTTGAPGTVQFEEGSTDIGSPVTVSGGTAQTSTSTLPVGADDLSAVFTPTAGSGYSGSTGTLTYTVATPTTTTLTASPTSPQFAGTSVTLTATVSPTLAGTVQFEVGTSPIGGPVTVSGGTAQTTTSTLPVGPDTLNAVFTPTDPDYSGSTGTTSYTINALTATTTTLTATPASPQFVGTAVTLKATVSPTASGTVQFEVGSTDIGSPVTVSGGIAQTTTSTLPVGPDTLKAVFTPTAGNGFSGSTGTANFTVNPLTSTTTTLTATPVSPQYVGTSVTLTATVTAGASGSVQFEVGSTDIGSPVTVSGGTAQTSTSTLPVGTDTLNAVFTPTAGNGYAGSTGSTTYTVKALNATTTVVTSSANPSKLGASVTFTATVTDEVTPTGTVTFKDGTTAISGCSAEALNGSNQATCTTSFPTGGAFAITAVYSGDPISSPSTSAVVTQVVGRAGKGYWLVASDGGIFNYGDAVYYGSTGSLTLNAPIVGMAATPDGKGYWLVASDGGIFNYGDATYYGSTGSLTLNKPIVGMAATPDGKGYWLVASDGGIFAYGDAKFYGSTGNLTLNKPIVGMAATPDGKGYWLVASDGGIFAYGDAKFYGSTGNLTLNKPIVGMAVTPDGQGYWLVASDGGIFAYGDAKFYGSTGNLTLNKPIVGMSATPDGKGYWLVASDGGIFNYGDATYYGSAGSLTLNAPIVGMGGA